MNRLLTCTAVAVLLGFTPALAADNSNLTTQPSVSPEAAKSAQQPGSGSADKSTGAMEQSSAPVGSGAASAHKPDHEAMSGGNADQSTGAKEQSSAPAGLSAADSSKPNPSLGGGESSKE